MLVTVVNQSLPLDFVTFNREWICKVDKDDLHTLLGYKSLVTLLDDCACKVLSKLDRCKADKLVVKPFHGFVFSFYRR